MTRKDMNLSMDRSLLRPKTDHLNKPNNPDDKNKDKDKSGHRHEPELRDPATPAAAYQPAHPVNRKSNLKRFMPLGIFVAHALLLLLTGLWLIAALEQPLASSTASIDAPASASSLEVAGIAEAQVEFDSKLKSLQLQLGDIQQQLGEMQVSTNSQQQLQATGQREMMTALQAGLKKLQTATASVTPVVVKPAAKNWYVNLGTFTEKQAAITLQKQLKTFGYGATINKLTLEKKVVHRVQLPGFSDRSSAETAAKEIMEKTNLNGLWAGQDA